MDLNDRTEPTRHTHHGEGVGRIPAMRLIAVERQRAQGLGMVQYFAPIAANPYRTLTLAQAWVAGHELAVLPPLPSSGRHTREYLKAVA